MSYASVVATQAVKKMIGSNVDPQIHSMCSYGSSGSNVVLVRHPTKDLVYAVKCAQRPRISLAEQVNRRNTIEYLLAGRFPGVLWLGSLGEYEVLIMEYRGSDTLHSLLSLSQVCDDTTFGIWENVLSTLSGVWSCSKEAPFQENICPRFYPLRHQKVLSRTKTLVIGGLRVWDYANLPVRVNGQDFLSLREAFGQLREVNNPEFGVSCHGDPSPSNIVVNRNMEWSLVDWEYSGRHQDWRMLISYLYGWWKTRYSLLQNKPNVTVQEGRLNIEYCLVIPDRIARYQSVVEKILLEFMPSVRKSDLVAMNCYLAILFLGELKLLPIWNREEYALPLLGEGVRVASRIVNDGGIGSFFWDR